MVTISVLEELQKQLREVLGALVLAEHDDDDDEAFLEIAKVELTGTLEGLKIIIAMEKAFTTTPEEQDEAFKTRTTH